MKKKSITFKYFMQYALQGISTTALGICFYLHEVGIASKLLVIIGLFACIGTLGFDLSFISKKISVEPEDEMTKLHRLKAESLCYQFLTRIFCIIVLVAYLIEKITDNYHHIQFGWASAMIVIGIIQIVFFLSFVIIEKVGDLGE